MCYSRPAAPLASGVHRVPKKVCGSNPMRLISVSCPEAIHVSTLKNDCCGSGNREGSCSLSIYDCLYIYGALHLENPPGLFPLLWVARWSKKSRLSGGFPREEEAGRVTRKIYRQPPGLVEQRRGPKHKQIEWIARRLRSINECS